LAVLTLLVLTISCSNTPTVIDGTSAESFAETTEKARRDLPIKDRLTFDAALLNPAGRRFGNKDVDGLARESFNGMTALDVVADARARGIE
jgi:hypothetical protein